MPKQQFLLLLDHTDMLYVWMKNPDGFEIEIPIFGRVDSAIRQAYDLVPAEEQPFETYTVVTLEKKKPVIVPEEEVTNGQ